MLYMSNVSNMKIDEYYIYDELYDPPPFCKTNMQNNMTQYAKYEPPPPYIDVKKQKT